VEKGHVESINGEIQASVSALNALAMIEATDDAIVTAQREAAETPAPSGPPPTTGPFAQPAAQESKIPVRTRANLPPPVQAKAGT
jgi:hypothetical protein